MKYQKTKQAVFNFYKFFLIHENIILCTNIKTDSNNYANYLWNDVNEKDHKLSNVHAGEMEFNYKPV